MQRAPRPWWFIARFVTAYAVLHALYARVPDEVLIHVVFHHALAAPAAAVLDVVAPGMAVEAVAHQLVSPRATLEIVRGCEGAGAFFMLAAAMLALGAGAGARPRTLGLAAGLALVYAINLARIVALYLVVVQRDDWFDLAHLYVAPLVVMTLIGAFFWWWSAAPPVRARAHAAA
jgi:exosortase family protein XrtM